MFIFRTFQDLIMYIKRDINEIYTNGPVWKGLIAQTYVYTYRKYAFRFSINENKQLTLFYKNAEK